jgi:hypothetical protein
VRIAKVDVRIASVVCDDGYEWCAALQMRFVSEHRRERWCAADGLFRLMKKLEV